MWPSQVPGLGPPVCIKGTGTAGRKGSNRRSGWRRAGVQALGRCSGFWGVN